MESLERFKIQFQQKYLHCHLRCLTRRSLFRWMGSFEVNGKLPIRTERTIKHFCLHLHNHWRADFSVLMERQPWPWSFSKKFRKYRNGGKWSGNILKSFWKIRKLSNSQKRKPFNRNFRKLQEESHMEHKFPVRTFRKFRDISQGWPLFLKFRELLFHSSLEIPEVLTWRLVKPAGSNLSSSSSSFICLYI